MSGRRIRRFLLLAAVVGLAYWIYTERPTPSGIIDTITSPLMGSRAAVKTSERNRVNSDAAATISEQAEAPVGALREGLTRQEVRDLLGSPDAIENESREGVELVRWTYRKAKRGLVFRGGRLVEIHVL